MSEDLKTLGAMADTALAAAQRWADESAYFAADQIEDARQMPAVILATTLAAALHYAVSLHAEGMADLADAIREAGQLIAGEKDRVNDGRQ